MLRLKWQMHVTAICMSMQEDSRVGGEGKGTGGEEDLKPDQLVSAVVQVDVHKIFRVINVFPC